MYFKPLRRSINQRKARLCEKGTAEEDGNCAIHGRSSNRPLRSCHWNQIVYRHPFEHQIKLAWRFSALSNKFSDREQIGIVTVFFGRKRRDDETDSRKDELALLNDMSAPI
jgi:hypothetical protein